MNRPVPPQMPAQRIAFEPDQDGLGEWARKTFINERSPLTNPDHEHLRDASIGWLWANMPSEIRGRRIAGEARIPKDSGARWSQMMGVMQIEDWFGFVPDFLVTIDAQFAAMADDATFCALVEHELYHCAQALDVNGIPRFNQMGQPVFTMRGHDVEQFVGVVERYGAVASGVAEMVEAAQRGPIVQDGAISAACGTCSGRRAA